MVPVRAIQIANSRGDHGRCLIVLQTAQLVLFPFVPLHGHKSYCPVGLCKILKPANSYYHRVFIVKTKNIELKLSYSQY